jgi:SAM-dependent methyltransferase
MKVGIITPIGPGHESSYQATIESIQTAWHNHRGSFTGLEVIDMPDPQGHHGRSARRNDGIAEGLRRGCDWLFFLDADDLLSPYAFEEVAEHLANNDAVWGNICESAFGANEVTLRKNQLPQTENIEDILRTDPYLTLQMGHFVRARIAAEVRFDESLDAGEDFRYYLKVWDKYRCKKVPSVFFINRRGHHSRGPRSADAQQWRASVEREIADFVARRCPTGSLAITAGPSSADLAADLARGQAAVIVAHPDDEILWSGGLLARHSGLDVICCSIPHRDPERVLGFFKAMKLLGHHPLLLPYSESNAHSPLTHLDLLELDHYATIITHNANGEYGHLHHRQVHQHLLNHFRGKLYAFGFGKGRLVLTLSAEEQSRKLAALQCYSNQSTADGGLPKWSALLKTYDIAFTEETYDLITAPVHISACGALSNAEIRRRSDYQIFSVSDSTISGIGERLQKKLRALQPVLPAFANRRVLDIGCDFGFWSFTAAAAGAEVVGLDRSRSVRDLGHVNIPLLNNQTAVENRLCAQFYDYEAGTQWWDLQKFDIVFCMSLYHHIFNLCGDHRAIWYWLARVTAGVLLWENPVDTTDTVVQMNLKRELWPDYTEQKIRAAALDHFDIDFEGPAIHEVTRSVWRLKPKINPPSVYHGTAQSGAGGAAQAFRHANNRRIAEIRNILGKEMVAGSLNVMLDENFDWERRYFRARLLDLADRSSGLSGSWVQRWVRFYPLNVNGTTAWAMRFEGEYYYPANFLELVSDRPLRPLLDEQQRLEILSV